MTESAFKLYGIFGFPLGHTLSPVMQEAAFQALGLKAFYLPFEVRPEEFRRLTRRLGALLLDGFNVTVPYKEEMMDCLGALTREARGIGAVNTVYRQNGRWIGTNTDLYGFLASLQSEGKFSPRGKKILVLGAGGSARAAVYGLAREGAREIRIANRRPARAKALIRDFKPLFRRALFKRLTLKKKDLAQGLEGIDLVVNATLVGLKPSDRAILPASLIPRSRGSQGRLLFFDFVYHRETPFLKGAKKRGHRTLSGGEMLVHQGTEAFRLWTGRKAPVEVMRAAFRQALARLH